MRDDSVTTAIASLAEGESYARALRLPYPVKKNVIPATLARMRNAVQSMTNRAAKHTGNQYATEAGVFFNRQFVPIMCVVITRLKPDPTTEAEDL